VRWLAGATAGVMLVACAYGGWEYRRAWAEAPAGTRGVEIVQPKHEDKPAPGDAGPKRDEEETAAEKKAAEERARQETGAKRPAEEAAREAERIAKAPFDGEWQVVGRGGDLCRFKDWKYNITIENHEIRVPKLPPGKVTQSGEFQYNYVAVGLPNAAPGVFTGTLAGASGKGRYNYSNVCHGSMTLNRL
jgi:hypothetical protein